MKHRLQRGILVAIEGIDGVGKTTQSLRLVDRLKALGFDAIRFFEPTKETPEAKLINQKLQQSNSRASGELTDLFLADRRYDVENYIAPALSEKKIVVMDRYFLSTAAYQADSRPWQDILEANREFAPEPDVSFIINWPAELALELVKKRDNGCLLYTSDAADE